MKKIGVLIFIIALVSSMTLVWAMTGKVSPGYTFKFGKIRGSGNIITDKRDLADFSGVSAGGAIELKITAGQNFSVEIEADDNIVPLVKTEVRGGVLHISREGRFSSRSRVTARVTLPELANLDLSGASRATVSGVKSDSLKINLSGASKTNIEGEARKLNLDLSGASKFDAENLRAETIDVDASGASKANVFASQSINAEASGASKIYYSGNPPSVTKDASGAGKIVSN